MKTFRDRLAEAGNKFDGHVTHGSLDEICKVIASVVGDAVYMTKKAGGYPVDGWGNCAECGGGPEGSIPHDVNCKHYEAGE